MRKLILIVLVGMLCFQSAYAQLAGDWKPVGPTLFPVNRASQINGIGRVTQIKFHPSDPQVLYATSASGGLWISRDGGRDWQKTGTDNLPKTQLASVCVDYTNDKIIYLGLGDPNYYTGSFGIWKSLDGGVSWSPANAGIGQRLPVEILMDPENPNILVAATGDGIWKSYDGGANWTAKKVGGNFTDMLFKAVPGTRTLFAATFSEYYRSTDMGETWTRITNGVNVPITGGGGMRLAVSAADTNIVYLGMVKGRGKLLKSTDGGSSFVTVKNEDYPNLVGYQPYNDDGQGNYNFDITADPVNANIVYVVSHNVWKSTDGGGKWEELTDYAGKEVHTDMHHIIHSPYDNTRLFNANDGGVFLSVDGGSNWIPSSHNLGATEIYRAGSSPIKKDMISIGTQDNGELYFSDNTWYCNRNGDWNTRATFDYLNKDAVYYLTFGRRRSVTELTELWLNFPFTPGTGVEMEFTPQNPHLSYISKNDIWRTTDLESAPPTWTRISSFNVPIKALKINPLNANTVYAYTSDGKIRRSQNALSSTPTYTTLTAPFISSTFTGLTVLKSDTSVVYLTIGPKVYRSPDRGNHLE